MEKIKPVKSPILQDSFPGRNGPVNFTKFTAQLGDGSYVPCQAIGKHKDFVEAAINEGRELELKGEKQWDTKMNHWKVVFAGGGGDGGGPGGMRGGGGGGGGGGSSYTGRRMSSADYAKMQHDVFTEHFTYVTQAIGSERLKADGVLAAAISICGTMTNTQMIAIKDGVVENGQPAAAPSDHQTGAPQGGGQSSGPANTTVPSDPNATVLAGEAAVLASIIPNLAANEIPDIQAKIIGSPTLNDAEKAALHYKLYQRGKALSGSN